MKINRGLSISLSSVLRPSPISAINIFFSYLSEICCLLFHVLNTTFSTALFSSNSVIVRHMRTATRTFSKLISSWITLDISKSFAMSAIVSLNFWVFCELPSYALSAAEYGISGWCGGLCNPRSPNSHWFLSLFIVFWVVLKLTVNVALESSVFGVFWVSGEVPFLICSSVSSAV